MKSEKMVEFSYRCKCGALVRGWSAKQLTDTEIASLKERDCDMCFLHMYTPVFLKKCFRKNWRQ